MNTKKKTTLLIIRIVTDLVMVSLAWVLAYYLRFYTFIESPKGVPPAALYLKLTPFIVVIWLSVFSAAGFYRRTLTQRSAFLEALDIFQSCILATLGFIAFSYFYEEYRYSRVSLLFFAVLHPWLVIFGRSVIRKLLRFYRRHSAPKGILIVGAGELLGKAIEFASMSDFEKTDIKGVVLVGNDQEKSASKALLAQRNLTTFDLPQDWPDFFTKHHVQSIYMAIPNSAYGFFETHLNQIASQVPEVKIIPDFIRYSRFAAGIDVIGGTPILNIHESPLEGFGSVIKRMVDIIGALVGITLSAPIMAVAAFAVRFSSPGPILYRQERMGLDGKTFNCLKFRSMRVDAEDHSGPVWAKEGDQRSTHVGKILRKYSIDELPQFFNVLKGDMSLVGPRPERPVFVHDFRKSIPGYMLRHKVKAGITGWRK